MAEAVTGQGSTIAKYEDYRVEEGGRLGEIWDIKQTVSIQHTIR